MGILAWILVGLITGWLAGLVIKSGGYGVIGDIVLGMIGAVVGGFVGGWLFDLSNSVTGLRLPTLLVAFLGAIIVVTVVRLVSGKPAT